MSALLSLTDINFAQANRLLLEKISFSVKRGQTQGLLGVNGAGKSTTLKIAAGILTPNSGYVQQAQPLRIGYLPESPPLIPQWTTMQFLQHICQLHSIAKQQSIAAIERVIELCDLAAVTHQHIATLSKGNQQRVAIAQSIVHQPDLLILDEPTSGLDPQQIIQFRSLIQSIKPQTGILFSSHIMHEVATLCDTALVIHNGRLMGQLDMPQSSNKLLIEFSEPIEESHFYSLPYWRLGSKKQHQFQAKNTEERQKIIAFCLQKNLPINKITGTEKLIEREFLSLINSGAKSA